MRAVRAQTAQLLDDALAARPLCSTKSTRAMIRRAVHRLVVVAETIHHELRISVVLNPIFAGSTVVLTVVRRLLNVGM